MHTIEVDFDVLKALMMHRETEHVTFNDALRKLLNLDTRGSADKPKSPSSDVDAWVTKSVTFPAGTEFRGVHKGVTHVGRVEASALVVSGKRYHSLSAAAGAITGTSVNGWIFWECRRPGETIWRLVSGLRKGR